MKMLVSMAALSLVAVMAVPAIAQDDADALYKSRCQACHGPDGKGDTPAGKKLGVKDFHSPDVSKMSDQELAEFTKKGKDKMPAYDKKLTDDQIKQLITYIRTLK
jgi:mono/diheme cytochrome c family protein